MGQRILKMFTMYSGAADPQQPSFLWLSFGATGQFNNWNCQFATTGDLDAASLGGQGLNAASAFAGKLIAARLMPATINGGRLQRLLCQLDPSWVDNANGWTSDLSLTPTGSSMQKQVISVADVLSPADYSSMSSNLLSLLAKTGLYK